MNPVCFDIRHPTSDDFRIIRPRERTIAAPPTFTPEILASLDSLPGLTFRSILRDGRLLAILGLWEWQTGVALAWGYVDRRAKNAEIVHLAYDISDYLPTLGLRRIEATARVDFPAGARWLEAIGFLPEGPMYCYGVEGETHMRFAMTFPEHVAAQTNGIQ